MSLAPSLTSDSASVCGTDSDSDSGSDSVSESG